MDVALDSPTRDGGAVFPETCVPWGWSDPSLLPLVPWEGSGVR